MPLQTFDLTPADPTSSHSASRGRPAPSRPLNICEHCGATSYRNIIERDEQGAMKPSGRYACTGCKREFTRVEDWRGQSAQTHPSAPPG